MAAHLNIEAWHDKSELPAIFWVWPGAGAGLEPYAADSYNADDPEQLPEVLTVSGGCRSLHEVAELCDMTEDEARRLYDEGDDAFLDATGWLPNDYEDEGGVNFIDEETLSMVKVESWSEAKEFIDPSDVELVESRVSA